MNLPEQALHQLFHPEGRLGRRLPAGPAALPRWIERMAGGDAQIADSLLEFLPVWGWRLLFHMSNSGLIFRRYSDDEFKRRHGSWNARARKHSIAGCYDHSHHQIAIRARHWSGQILHHELGHVLDRMVSSLKSSFSVGLWHGFGPSRHGFLTDYARLTKATGGDGALCWRKPEVNLARYDKVLITRILVTLKADQQQGVDPTDLKALVDYFHKALVRDLKPQFRIVDEPGPGVLVLRIALTNLVPTQVGRSLVGTAVPYGFAAEVASGPASGRPAGSTPYLGETGIEMQFLDGASNVVIGECADTQIGRKYAADVDSGAAGATDTWVKGYMSSFQSWSYARDAFDKWARQIAQRLAVLRGVTPAQ